MAAQEDAHKNSIIARNNILWESAEYSDLTIRCGSREFKVHRAIVCPGSHYFSTACNGQFKEGRTRIIELKEDDPPTVHRILRYFYNLDYDDTGDAASIAPYMLEETSVNDAEVIEDLTETEKALHTQLLNNIIVYAIANKYDIPQLKLLAREKVEMLLSKHTMSPDLPLIIDVIFKTTPSSDKDLRSVAITFCKGHVCDLESEGYLSYLLINHGDLALGMVLELMQSRPNDESLLRAGLDAVGAQLDCIEHRATSVLRRVPSWESDDDEIAIRSDVKTIKARVTNAREVLNNIS